MQNAHVTSSASPNKKTEGDGLEGSDGASPHRKEIKVYITGFGPFLNITDNPSYAIASSFLPSSSLTIHLPNSSKLCITITPHPTPIKVAYNTVDTVIPDVYSADSFDYILHIGAGSDGGYLIENLAHSDGYLRGDVDGLLPGGKRVMPMKELRKLILTGEITHWAGNNTTIDPRTVNGAKTEGWLATALDTEWIAKVASGLWGKFTCISAPDKDDGGSENERELREKPHKKYFCTPSFNAGRYLCEYIYYISLKEAIFKRLQHHKANENQAYHASGKINKEAPIRNFERDEASLTSKRVLFLHVPKLGHPYSLEDGQEVLKRIVVAMVLDGEGLRRKL